LPRSESVRGEMRSIFHWDQTNQTNQRNQIEEISQIYAIMIKKQFDSKLDGGE
jgi:hypothetical protein